MMGRDCLVCGREIPVNETVIILGACVGCDPRKLIADLTEQLREANSILLEYTIAMRQDVAARKTPWRWTTLRAEKADKASGIYLTKYGIVQEARAILEESEGETDG